jgi:hypothetical protein
MSKQFLEIIDLIKQSRAKAIRAVNAELIQLYWSIGEYISAKLEKSVGRIIWPFSHGVSPSKKEILP